MNRYGIAASILVAGLFGMLLGSPVGSAAAGVPTHAVGDKVGFGTTIDLGAAAAPVIRLIKEFDAHDPNITVHELKFGGSFDLWSTTEVVGKSPDAYSIRSNAALGFKVDYVVNVTSTQLPKAGTYPGDRSSGTCMPPASIPLTTETIFADVNLTYLLSTTDLSSWTISAFSLLGDERNMSIGLSGPAVYRNIPYIELNQTSCELTVEYITIDVTLSADVSLDTQAAYTPALDLFAFPIADGETWPVQSMLTQAGHVQGTLDVKGLEPDQEREFFDHVHHAFDMAGLSAAGLDRFPIVLENVTILAGTTPVLKDGVIHDFTVPVNATLHARETKMTLADGNLHTVFLISDASGGLCSQVYSPDDRFVVGVRCDFQGITVFELPNVPAATAEDNIGKTKRDYAPRPAAQGGSDAVASLFAQPPFLGSLIVAIVVIVVVALFVWRRIRPPAGRPPTPPESPPPGSPPPGNP